MRRRTVVSSEDMSLCAFVISIYVLSSENVFFPLLHRSSCQILPPTPTSMLVYVQMLLVVVRVAHSLARGPPRYVVPVHLIPL